MKLKINNIDIEGKESDVLKVVKKVMYENKWCNREETIKLNYHKNESIEKFRLPKNQLPV